MADVKLRMVRTVNKGAYMGPPLPLTKSGNMLKVESFGRRVNVDFAIAERAIGKRLPDGAEVHHIDGDRNKNDASNLVVCENRAYHAMLHRRMRAMEATGNPDGLLCQVCSSYENQWDMRDYEAGRGQRFRIHGACMKKRNAANKQRRKELKHAAMAARGFYLDVTKWRPFPSAA